MRSIDERGHLNCVMSWQTKKVRFSNHEQSGALCALGFYTETLASWISPDTRMKENEQKSWHQNQTLYVYFPWITLMIRFTLPEVMHLPRLSEFKQHTNMLVSFCELGSKLCVFALRSFFSLCMECRGAVCVAGT